MSDIDFSDPFSNTSVGIVIGSLVVQGGAEEVARTLARELNSPIYTVEYDEQRFDKDFREDVKGRIVELNTAQTDISNDFDSFKLRYSPVQNISHQQFENVNYDDIATDILIATDIEAATLAYNSGSDYVTYIHHPGKVFSDYFWEEFDRKDGIVTKLKFLNERRKTVKHMKSVAKASDKLIANSVRTKERTKESWGVDDDHITVAYPPIDTEINSPGQAGELPISVDRFFVAPQRLEPYKNINTLIEAAKRAREHLVITGHGTMEDYVRREAQYSKFIHSLGYVDDDVLADLFRESEAAMQGTLREDFGIVPVEAMAAGTPSIVPASGGFLETIGDGYTDELPETYKTERGLLIGAEDYGVTALAGAMQNFDRDDYAPPDELASQAQKYSTEAFTDQMQQLLNDVYEGNL